MLYKLLIAFIAFFIMVFLAACGSQESAKSPTYSDFEIVSHKLSSTLIYPNSLEKIDIDLYSAQSYSSENKDSEIFFFFALKNVNDANETIWFDSNSLQEVQAGLHTYSFELSIPADVNASRYTLEMQVSNQDRVLNTFSSSAFDILNHDNKADLELLSFTLDLDNGAIDDEYDTINSSEINSTQNLTNIINSGLTLYDLNETFYASASVKVRSNIKAATNVIVSACVQIGSATCIDLPIMQVQNKTQATTFDSEDNESINANLVPTFSTNLNIGDMDENEEANIALDLALPATQLQTFVDSVLSNVSVFSGSVVHGTILIKLSSDNDSSLNTQNNTSAYPFDIMLTDEIVNSIVTLHNAPARLSSAKLASANSGCGLKKLNYEKEYSKQKYGDKFGAGAYLLGRAYLDIDGVHAKTYASIRVKRFSDTKFRLLRVNASADISPGSFEDTGYDIELSSLGKNIYSKSYSLAQLSGLSTPLVSLSVEEERMIATGGKTNSDRNVTDSNTTLDANTSTAIDTNTTVTSRATLLRQKKYKALKDNLKTYKLSSTTNVSLVSIDQNFRVGKNIERKQTVMFAIVPIVITAGAEARIGFDASIGLDGITSISAMIEPNAYIGGYLEAGVGASISCCFVDIDYSAGVGGNLWLISERFTSRVNATLDLVDDGEYIVAVDGNLHENITNYLSTMNGRVYAYARYFGPYKFSAPTDSAWKNRTKSKDFANWSGSQYTRELLDEKQTLFSIPLADECE